MVDATVGAIRPSTLASSAAAIRPEAIEWPIGSARQPEADSLGLGVLDNRRHALADADTQRRHAIAGFPAPHLPDEGREEPGPRAAEGVAQGDRASVDVQPILLDAE